jgi:ATP/maltotriose-dependent transcriptional regulator MalT
MAWRQASVLVGYSAPLTHTFAGTRLACSVLTILLNEITTLPKASVLVLDDYHVIESKPVEEALAFLLEDLPPQMHLITTREDPDLPLSRLRARSQMTELRAADLRFSPAEAAESHLWLTRLIPHGIVGTTDQEGCILLAFL